MKGEKKKGSPALNTYAPEEREACAMLWKEAGSAAVIVGFTFPFWSININALLWRQLAACVFFQSFGGILIEKASVRVCDYRAAQLSGRPVRPLITSPSSFPFFRPLHSPLLYLLQTMQSCCAGALCGLCSTKRISVWTLVLKTHTGHRKYNMCQFWVMIWISMRGWNDFKNRCAEWKLGGLSEKITI